MNALNQSGESGWGEGKANVQNQPSAWKEAGTLSNACI
jgi:hypothetical protein